MSNSTHLRKSSSLIHNGSIIGNRLLQAKMEDLATLKKMITFKMIELSQNDLGRIQFHQKLLKSLKKESKDKKLSDVQTNILFQGLFDDIDNLIKECIWSFRAERTDFQSLFIKLKLNDKMGNQSHSFQQIIKMHDRKPDQLLLNSSVQVLAQQKNIIQNFPIQTLCQKAIQLLSSTSFRTEILHKVSQHNLRNLVDQIAKGYNIVPYHNFSHGFGVFLSFFSLNSQISSLKGYLTDLELFFTSIACLSHDIDHNGNNTLFEVKTESDLAVKYGHFSVMEKMHLAKTMDILDRNQKTNAVFQALDQQDKNKARKIVAKAILATDMSQHYILLDEIKDKTLDNTQQDRALVIQNLVHACDIENPALDYECYLSWAQLVCIEFHDQTVKQQLWNVEVTEFLKFDSLPYFYKNQLSFASSIVLPLWKSLGVLFPEIDEKGYPEKIKKNISMMTESMRRNSESFSKRPIEKYLIFQLAN